MSSGTWQDGDALTPANLNTLGGWSDPSDITAAIATAVSALSSAISSVQTSLASSFPVDLSTSSVTGELPWQRLPSSTSTWLLSSGATIGIGAVLSVHSTARIGSAAPLNAAFDAERAAASIRRDSADTTFQMGAHVLMRSSASTSGGFHGLNVQSIYSSLATQAAHTNDAIQAVARISGAGAIDNLTGVYGIVNRNLSSAGTVTNARALRAGFVDGSGIGSIATAFGLYVDEMILGTNKIAIWTYDGEVQFSQGSFVYSRTSGVKWGNGPYISSSSSVLAGASSSGSAYLLAYRIFHPTVTVTTTTSATTALVNSNVSVTFTAPSSGSVYVILSSAVSGDINPGVNTEHSWGLLGDTASIQSSEMVVQFNRHSEADVMRLARRAVAVSPVLPVSGTTTWVFAQRRITGSDTVATVYGGAYGPIIMQVWALT